MEKQTCTISFDDPNQKDNAFQYLVHAKSRFTGVDKNTIIIQKSDCDALKNRGIKYQHQD